VTTIFCGDFFGKRRHLTKESSVTTLPLAGATRLMMCSHLTTAPLHHAADLGSPSDSSGKYALALTDEGVRWQSWVEPVCNRPLIKASLRSHVVMSIDRYNRENPLGCCVPSKIGAGGSIEAASDEPCVQLPA